MRSVWIVVGLAVIGLLLLLAIGLVLLAASRTVPRAEPTEGELRACPDSPNCVCSNSPPDDAEHHIEPFDTGVDPRAAFDRLRTIVLAQPYTRVIAEADGYIHAESATPWLGFRDDVELLLDENAKVVHVRSASRVGRSDLGANRNRIERIRAAYTAAD